MSQSNSVKILVGATLLLACTALILFVSSTGEAIIPGLVGSVAVLGVAAGTLMLGTSDSDGRPV
jgi:hypothetical protein